VGRARRFYNEITDGVKRAKGILKQMTLQALRQELESMLPRGK
jgi:hypothetical protein